MGSVNTISNSNGIHRKRILDPWVGYSRCPKLWKITEVTFWNGRSNSQIKIHTRTKCQLGMAWTSFRFIINAIPMLLTFISVNFLCFEHVFCWKQRSGSKFKSLHSVWIYNIYENTATRGQWVNAITTLRHPKMAMGIIDDKLILVQGWGLLKLRSLISPLREILI